MNPCAQSFRRAIAIVAVLNLAYFGLEFAMAMRIGSVSLFADSIDFLEDALVNVLILVALGWSLVARARLGMVLAGVLVLPGLATVITAWQQFIQHSPPQALVLSAVGFGALVVNGVCAVLLTRHRDHGGSFGKAAFLSARNDVFANLAIIMAGLATAATSSKWPDLVVGLGIGAMNIDAARAVYAAARTEHAEARA